MRVRRFLLGSALVAISLALLAGSGSAALNPTVGPNVNVTKASGNQAEGTIAVNPTNPNQLFVASNPGATSRRSTDGGATWIAAGAGIPASCCDNVAAWDSFGNLFLVNINAALNAVVLFLSTDGGANFTTLQTIDTGSIDQPSVKAGAGSVWVTWNDGTIKARGAAVTGLGAGNVGAFTAEQAAPGAGGVGGQFGDIAIGPSGQVTVTYQSDTDIYVNTDADGLGAGGFAAQVHVSSTNVAKFDSITPQDARTIDAEANLAWDRSGGAHDGRLYLSYTDESPDESNNTDVDVRHSDDNGATWSSALKVNDDATTRAQFLPIISIDQTTGNVAMAWHDARNDPGNNLTQFWGAVSDTGGASFGANFQISAGVSNDDTALSGVDYGDYTWGDSFGNVFHPVWSDNSNSTGDNPDGANSRFDIYTAAVTINNTPPVLTVPGPADSRLPRLTVVQRLCDRRRPWRHALVQRRRLAGRTVVDGPRQRDSDSVGHGHGHSWRVRGDDLGRRRSQPARLRHRDDHGHERGDHYSLHRAIRDRAGVLRHAQRTIARGRRHSDRGTNTYPERRRQQLRNRPDRRERERQLHDPGRHRTTRPADRQGRVRGRHVLPAIIRDQHGDRVRLPGRRDIRAWRLNRRSGRTNDDPHLLGIQLVEPERTQWKRAGTVVQGLR